MNCYPLSSKTLRLTPTRFWVKLGLTVFSVFHEIPEDIHENQTKMTKEKARHRMAAYHWEGASAP